MPGDEVFCDQCVPRGCSCNNIDFSIEELNHIKKENLNYRFSYSFNKNKDGKISHLNFYIIPFDDYNREFPCCEFEKI